MTLQIDSDVCILGIGLSGCSLALALLNRGFKGRIVMLEQNQTVDTNKTWCFWNESILPDYLRKLISKRWSSWLVGYDSHMADHKITSDGLHYCCIRASDFYAMALSRLEKAENVNLVFKSTAKRLPSDNKVAKISVEGAEISSRWGFDSGMKSQLVEGTQIYQSFSGAWIKTRHPAFDDTCAQLMTEMQAISSGLEFTYILPFSRHNALVELTRFSSQTEKLHDLKVRTQALVQDRFANNVVIENWESGMLPMTENLRPASEGRWHNIGINGGHIRASTGYAFLSIQRFSQSAATSIMADKRIEMKPFERYYNWMDKIFLRVLKRYPTLSPTLFTEMIRKTEPEQFARFMSESATIKDLMSVVMAMPKQPFIRALW